MNDENDKMSVGITQVLWGHVIFLVIPLALSILVSLPRRFFGAIQTIPIILWFWAGWVFLFQLIYVIPFSIVAKRKNRKETLKGILTAFGVTFLLSGLTCGASWLVLNGGRMFR